jgi:hypothetical protein
VKIDLQTAVSIVGVLLTAVFGVWSVVTGKVKTDSRFSKIFLVLLTLYTGQFLSARLFGQPFVNEVIFSLTIFVMVLWIMGAVFNGD